MPDLPTLTLSQEHFDRVVSAFPGDTAGEKVASYRAWLSGMLIDFVRASETEKIEAAHRVQINAEIAAVVNSLPPRPIYPPAGI